MRAPLPVLALSVILVAGGVELRAAPARPKTKSSAKAAGRKKLAALEIAFTPEEFIDRAHKGDLTAVKLFLEAGMDVNVNPKDPRGLVQGTALELAAGYGTKEVLGLLLEHGADTETKDWVGNTPLNFACGRESGAPDIVALLLDHGAKPNNARKDGWAPLHAAVQSGCDKCVELLLGKGADANAKTGNGWTPLSLTKSLFGEPDPAKEGIRDRLLQAGASQ